MAKNNKNQERYYQRIISPPKDNSFFLFGPRGTGKTTWLKKTYKKALYFDLLSYDTYKRLLARPEILEDLIPDGFRDWIILDEIQRVPELLNEVHRLIENKKYKFILTGSSARKLRREGVNLLAGRLYTYTMHPLTAIELGDDFSLSKSIKYGHLPKACTSDNPAEFLSSYVQTYIKEEVEEEGLTRQIGNFYRFLETASFSQGEVLNISEIAREAMLKRSLVENYFSILEDLLLAVRVPVFNKRAKRVLLKHDKFYFFDVGVFREIRPAGPLDSESEIDGPALETLVLQELNAVNQYKRLGYKIYYWRTKTGLEVDFVLYGKRGLLAMEIKRKPTVTKKDLRGLRAFKKDYPEAIALVLYGGREKIYYDNIPVLPFNYFFRRSIDVLMGKI